jgi:hypothetical protein
MMTGGGVGGVVVAAVVVAVVTVDIVIAGVCGEWQCGWLVAGMCRVAVVAAASSVPGL